MLDMLCYACHFMLCCHCLIFSFYFFYFFYHCMCVCVLYHEYDFSNNNNYTYFTDLRSQSHITKRDLDLWRLRCPAAHPPIGATTIRTGGDLGDKQCIGPSKFLAVYFKKQEILQQVVTKMQDLVFEFSKISREWYPRTLTAGGGDPSRTQHPDRPLAGRGAGTQTLVPLNFSAVVAPLHPPFYCTKYNKPRIETRISVILLLYAIIPCYTCLFLRSFLNLSLACRIIYMRTKGLKFWESFTKSQRLYEIMRRNVFRYY